MSTKRLLKRMVCALLGCITDIDPDCCRCGAGIYNPEFVQTGRLDPLFRLYWRIRNALRKLVPRRCEQCGKRFMRGYDPYVCSEKCFDDWLPVLRLQ